MKIMKEKLCATCKTKKPVAEFHKNKKDSSGYRSSCKVCTRIKYLRNKDHHQTKRKDYYRKNREELLKKARSRYLASAKGKSIEIARKKAAALEAQVNELIKRDIESLNKIKGLEAEVKTLKTILKQKDNFMLPFGKNSDNF